MKVNGLIERCKNTDIDIVAELNVKTYLPFYQKKALAERVINRCKVEDEGYIKINEIDKYMIFTIEVIQAYTDLEFNDDYDVATMEYDKLCQAGILGNIIEPFKNEYNMVNTFVSMEADYVLSKNSVEAQVAKFLDKLSSGLDTFSDVLMGQISNFDIDKLGIKQDDVAQLMDFINKNK